MIALGRRQLLRTAAALGASVFVPWSTGLAAAAPLVDDQPPPDGGSSNPSPLWMASAALSDVQLSRDYVYYDLPGSSVAALQAGIARLGPRDVFGAWAAATSWDLNWSLRYSTPDGRCALASAVVTVSTRMVLPRWAPPANAHSRLVAQWKRYSAALTEHERGHEQIATQAGAELLAALRNLAPGAACDNLDVAARSLAQDIVARYDVLQQNYDRDTGHGATQGATFP